MRSTTVQKDAHPSLIRLLNRRLTPKDHIRCPLQVHVQVLMEPSSLQATVAAISKQLISLPAMVHTSTVLCSNTFIRPAGAEIPFTGTGTSVLIEGGQKGVLGVSSVDCLRPICRLSPIFAVTD